MALKRTQPCWVSSAIVTSSRMHSLASSRWTALGPSTVQRASEIVAELGLQRVVRGAPPVGIAWMMLSVAVSCSIAPALWVRIGPVMQRSSVRVVMLAWTHR